MHPVTGITYKTAYRQAVKMDYRRRYQWLPWLLREQRQCVPRCTKECVHGRCVCSRTAASVREAGVTTTAPVPAMTNTGGPGCGQLCKCENGGLCNPVTAVRRHAQGCPSRARCDAHAQTGASASGKGVCACPPGWTGEVCTERCAEGRFGPNCASSVFVTTGATATLRQASASVLKASLEQVQ
ncbi:hypothetical protein J4Q44_G00019370 [Coregonus suidteri]|uniref:EGF-like domain-containing protein n=1 Tax=Coregonus suidteri TaxID=861788 RepID=A0AAN8MG13_9TELE